MRTEESSRPVDEDFPGAFGACLGRVLRRVGHSRKSWAQSWLARCVLMNQERSKIRTLTISTQVGNAIVSHMLTSLAINNATATR